MREEFFVCKDFSFSAFLCVNALLPLPPRSITVEFSLHSLWCFTRNYYNNFKLRELRAV